MRLPLPVAIQTMVATTVFAASSLGAVQAQQTSTETVVARSTPAVALLVARTPAGVLQGSAFIVHPDGTLVTNYHVIEHAEGAYLKLPSGEIYDRVRVLVTDDRRDVAILKIDGFSLPVLQLGNSDSIGVGARVMTIGSPLGLENTVTDGLVSGFRDMGGYKWIQLSTPISPGSSGGPVLNMTGQVVGVAVAQIQGGQNLNFAVPINYVRGLMQRATFASGTDLAALRPDDSSIPEAVNSQLVLDLESASDYTAVYREDLATGLSGQGVLSFAVLGSGDTARYEVRDDNELRYKGNVVQRRQQRDVFVGPHFSPMASYATTTWLTDSGWQVAAADLKYSSYLVAGTLREPEKGQRRVEDRLPKGIITAPNTAFAWLTDSVMNAGVINFQVYSVMDSKVLDHQFRVLGTRTVDVRAGRFEAIEVEVAVGSSVSRGFYTKSAPHILLRLEDSNLKRELLSLSFPRGRPQTPPLPITEPDTSYIGRVTVTRALARAHANPEAASEVVFRLKDEAVLPVFQELPDWYGVVVRGRRVFIRKIDVRTSK